MKTYKIFDALGRFFIELACWPLEGWTHSIGGWFYGVGMELAEHQCPHENIVDGATASDALLPTSRVCADCGLVRGLSEHAAVRVKGPKKGTVKDEQDH